MRRGVPMEPGLDSLVPRVLSLFLLTHLCLAHSLAAPGTQREESADAPPPPAELANPFGSGPEDRRLLQSYIQASLKDGQGGPESSTWEQDVFFLFRLYDYDRSGHMDGLEMMKLLSDYNSHNAPEAKANERRVVSMVDFILQTQDLNRDGLLIPSELLSPPLPPHTQLHQGQDPEEQKKTGPGEEEEEELQGGGDQQKLHHEEAEPKEEVPPPEHEVKTQEEEARQEIEKQDELQILEQGQGHSAPVHPEI